MTPDCPHCPDGHGKPNRTAWAVWVSDWVDYDGQPTHLVVTPTGGKHVAEADAEWLRRLIRERDRSQDEPGYWIEVHPSGWPHRRIPTPDPLTPGYRALWIPWRGPGPVPPMPPLWPLPEEEDER